MTTPASTEMARGYAFATLAFNNLADLYNGENEFGEFGDYADTVLNEYNPDLVEKAEEVITSNAAVVARCEAFYAKFGDTLKTLIDEGKCEDWFSHGCDLASGVQRIGVGFTDRGYGEAGEILAAGAREAGYEGVTLWTIPEGGPIAKATGFMYEEM